MRMGHSGYCPRLKEHGARIHRKGYHFAGCQDRSGDGVLIQVVILSHTGGHPVRQLDAKSAVKIPRKAIGRVLSANEVAGALEWLA